MRKYNVVLCTVVCVFLVCLLCVTYGYSIANKRVKSNDFDVLLFTQHWPPGVCYKWKARSESNSCSLPKKDKWTIHGTWPSQFHRLGPQFCNKSLLFNESVLAPIKNKLTENWLDIHNTSTPYPFWKHEWDKHGTCAVTVKDLDSQFKYFQTSLKLLDTYNMIDVLAKANILPGQKYMIDDFLHAIEKILGKRGQVICTKDKKTDESYVYEIRICFDKTLRLVNCDGVYKFPTNCDKSNLITYPGRVPHYQVIQT